jgi:mannose-6-phosphate isomerase
VGGILRTVARGELAPEALVDERPWGRFEQLVLNERVTVKIITVEPGQRLSLQRHQYRDEWWTVLDDGLSVEVGAQRTPRIAAAGEQFWIPRGITHRAANCTDRPLRFLEIALGAFDEADIERLADDYAR